MPWFKHNNQINNITHRGKGNNQKEITNENIPRDPLALLPSKKQQQQPSPPPPLSRRSPTLPAIRDKTTESFLRRLHLEEAAATARSSVAASRHRGLPHNPCGAGHAHRQLTGHRAGRSSCGSPWKAAECGAHRATSVVEAAMGRI
jgi:hypothetical protein